MAGRPYTPTIDKQFRTLFSIGATGAMTDRTLLEHFARGGEAAEPAFASLVERHGPMVMRVCRNLLADLHLAEDAFQVTFLLLARRAGSIHKPDALAGWLHRVARRVAIRARVRTERVDWEQSQAADAAVTGDNRLERDELQRDRPPGDRPARQHPAPADLTLCARGTLSRRGSPAARLAGGDDQEPPRPRSPPTGSAADSTRSRPRDRAHGGRRYDGSPGRRAAGPGRGHHANRRGRRGGRERGSRGRRTLGDGRVITQKGAEHHVLHQAKARDRHDLGSRDCRRFDRRGTWPELGKDQGDRRNDAHRIKDPNRKRRNRVPNQAE